MAVTRAVPQKPSVLLCSPPHRDWRKESDSLGPVDVPVDAYYGPQTQRCIDNFDIGDATLEAMPKEIIHALGQVKAACAKANLKFGRLEAPLAEAIIAASEEVASGALDSHFPLRWIQTGSGTQSNMNCNEVIARRASQMIDGDAYDPRAKTTVHPNDHVNLGQSSNDVFPTAMHVCLAVALQAKLLPALDSFAKELNTKAAAWASIVKIGRTHLMDATPLTLGQEVSAWAYAIEESRNAMSPGTPCYDRICKLAQGGTAVGTGLNTCVGFDVEVAKNLESQLDVPFKTHPNKFAALSVKDGCAGLHAEIGVLASTVFKIAQDIRLLGSGPRCGLGELSLPSNEPGSSIMPGKVNPTQCEALTSICALVHGNGSAVSFAASQGHMQLNVFKPMMTATTLRSIRLLADGMNQFRIACLEGLQCNERRLETLKNESLMLVTCLTPIIGYDAAGKAALHAHETGVTLKEVVVNQRELISEEEFIKHVNPTLMLSPFELK